VDHDGAAAGRLAENRHRLRVAAEGRDVALNPLHGAALIHVAVIAVNLIGRLGEQRRMGKETEPAHPIVHADEDDAKLSQCVAPGVKRSLSAHIRAAVNPNHDGQRFG